MNNRFCCLILCKKTEKLTHDLQIVTGPTIDGYPGHNPGKLINYLIISDFLSYLFWISKEFNYFRWKFAAAIAGREWWSEAALFEFQ